MSFQIPDKDLKNYPHFDRLISPEKLLEIVTDPEKVRINAFFPFLQYSKKYQPFRRKSKKPNVKQRLIRYASRRDAAIFSYYRFLLSQPYEARLATLGIHDVPIAYRKIPVDSSSAKGKCNIEFASDLFSEVLRQRNSVVVTLDISKYFECIDHRRLYKVWCDLLKVESLPRDHLAVFKAITRFVVVDRSAVYERLGYIGQKLRHDGSTGKGYLRSFKAMPKQLCSPADFRNKILGKDPNFPSLCQPNKEPFGIPQGAPISDLLANAYLIDFDVAVSQYARSRGGRYWRYSDDIVLVLPGGDAPGYEAKAYVTELISQFGDELEIKESKTSIVKFNEVNCSSLNFQLVDGLQGHNGLEYLGFRFDGKNVYLRNSTLSNFYRKITRRARRQARRHAIRFPGKSADWLMEEFDFHQFEKGFGRVRDFESVATKKGWTFWTYAKRASEHFGVRGKSIYKQVSRYRTYIRKAVKKEIYSRLTRAEAQASK
jgi:hypothetical protein